MSNEGLMNWKYCIWKKRRKGPYPQKHPKNTCDDYRMNTLTKGDGCSYCKVNKRWDPLYHIDDYSVIPMNED